MVTCVQLVDFGHEIINEQRVENWGGNRSLFDALGYLKILGDRNIDAKAYLRT